jgi:glycosyltransferase involved in cell wall biosynthesis
MVEVASEQWRRGQRLLVICGEEVATRLPEGVPRKVIDFKRPRLSTVLLYQVVRAVRQSGAGLLHAHANKAAFLAKLTKRFVPGLRTVATIQNTKRCVGAFRGHDAVIAVSHRAGQASGSIPHRVIWNAIPRPGSASVDQSVVPADYRKHAVVGAYGRFVSAKGFDFLLEAMAPLENVTLWLIGDGPLRADREAQALRLGMKDRVWFAGFRRDAEALMTLADLFVLPSLHEGFPFTLVEMLHREMPTLSSRVAGAEEIMPESCLFEIGDVEAMREGIRRALANPEKWKDGLQGAFAQARDNLEIGVCCDRIEQLYQSIPAPDSKGRN